MKQQSIILPILTCLLLGTPSTAQSEDVGLVEPVQRIDLRMADLKPVDAFTGDATALSTSLRSVQYGLQQSSNFEQLMQSGMHGDRYYRQAGGLYAMFPNSTYQATKSGYVPTIAPGTVFHIGGLPPADVVITRTPDPSRIAADPLSPQMRADRHDVRDQEGIASSGPQPVVEATAVPVEPVRIRFITDEDYRRRTVMSLVWRSIEASLPEPSQAARGPLPSDSK